MKETFHGWASAGKMDIDTVSNLIVTGKKAAEAMPDRWIFPFVGNEFSLIRILDFGCGFGRNAFGISTQFPHWSVTGYDNEGMISKTAEFSQIHYRGKIPSNLRFETDWENLRTQKFDCIYCTIVLQHIYEDALAQYASDFKQMTKRLVVAGRRYNDERNRSTWTILQEQGMVPAEFYRGNQKIAFLPEGNDHDHHTAVYIL